MMYEVEINFNGFRGCSEVYTVDADSEEDAQEVALEEAAYDLEVDDVREADEDEDEDE